MASKFTKAQILNKITTIFPDFQLHASYYFWRCLPSVYYRCHQIEMIRYALPTGKSQYRIQRHVRNTFHASMASMRSASAETEPFSIMKWEFARIAMWRHVIYVNSIRNRCSCCHSKGIAQSMKQLTESIDECENISSFFPIFRYIVCYGTSRVERECANGFYFDAKLGMCDQRENIQCEYSSNDQDGKPSSPIIGCRANDQVEFVPSLESCEEHFICVNGQSTAHNCSDGLIYNIELKRCTTTGRCLLDYEPTCGTSGTFLPHLFECRHFFYCDPDEVQPLLQACKLGELFDRSILRCVPEGEATCFDPPDKDLEEWPKQWTPPIQQIKFICIYELDWIKE